MNHGKPLIVWLLATASALAAAAPCIQYPPADTPNPKTAYRATYSFDFNFEKKKKSDKGITKNHNAPIRIKRTYSRYEDKAVHNYSDEILLCFLPQDSALATELAGQLAPIIQESQKHIKAYDPDNSFLTHYTAPTAQGIKKKWARWGQARPRMIIIYRKANQVVPIGELGENLENKPHGEIPLFYFRGSNKALQKRIDEAYKGMIYLALIGFIHYQFTTKPSLKKFTACTEMKNQASEERLKQLGFRFLFTQKERHGRYNETHFELDRKTFYKQHPSFLPSASSHSPPVKGFKKVSPKKAPVSSQPNPPSAQPPLAPRSPNLSGEEVSGIPLYLGIVLFLSAGLWLLGGLRPAAPRPKSSKKKKDLPASSVSPKRGPRQTTAKKS